MSEKIPILREPKPEPEPKGEQYHTFAGKYDKASLMSRFKIIDGTRMGKLIDYELNQVGLNFELDTLDYTENDAKNIASLLGGMYLAIEHDDEAGAKQDAKELADFLLSVARRT